MGGGVTRNYFLMPVSDRSAKTLEVIIQSYIAPGTALIIDGWPTYKTLSNLVVDINNHRFINLRARFLHSYDENIHTETV